MNYFVTGTDTGAGKTLVSCALLHGFAAQGRRSAGFKPVAAGCDADGRNGDAKALLAASAAALAYEQVNPYCLGQPIAPHLAAQHEGVRIELARIIAAFEALAAQTDVVVVEGAGGFKVPLNEREDGSDLARALGLPVILVVGMRLGCLNHALLTVSAIAACGLKCAGWIANVAEDGMAELPGNIATLQQRIAAPLLGVVPHMAEPDPRIAAERLDFALLGK